MQISTVAVILLSVGLLSPGLSQDIAYGMNYDVVSTDTNLTTNCTSDPNVTVHEKSFLPRYASSVMRRNVRTELKELNSSGFQIVRSIVQLYPGDHPSGDLINIERIDRNVVDAVKEYARDVRDAGFKQLIIAFGTQGTANTGCRKSEWGDCFDPVTVSAAVDAEARIIRAAQSVSGISLRVDLLNEACVSDRDPPLAKENFVTFVRAAAKMHAANFPTVPATVSCQLERTADGLAATSQLFVESGDHIGFFDIHAYPGVINNEAEVLTQAAKSLKGMNIPIIFGETTYSDPQYRHVIVEAFQAAFHQYPREIIFWPVYSTASHCNFDVPQPYRLKDAVGQRSGG